jgi:hypothetical protein
MREKTDAPITTAKLQTVAGEKATNANMMCSSYACSHQLLDYPDPFIENYLSIYDPKTKLYMSTQKRLRYVNPYEKMDSIDSFQRVSLQENIK